MPLTYSTNLTAEQYKQLRYEMLVNVEKLERGAYFDSGKMGSDSN